MKYGFPQIKDPIVATIIIVLIEMALTSFEKRLKADKPPKSLPTLSKNDMNKTNKD